MLQDIAPLFSESFLSRHWEAEFDRFLRESDARIRASLEQWRGRPKLSESEEEAAFIAVFFHDQWGYRASGQIEGGTPYTLRQQFPVAGAGQQGGVGKADLALGFFRGEGSDIPQVLCEFKDVRSGLDQRQHRQGNDRSPVKQCFDYLKGASDRLYGHEPVRPTWGIVTNMDEFRLYSRARGPVACQRFVLTPTSVDPLPSLVGEGEGAAFQRFLFTRLFSQPMLLAHAGPSPLERMLGEQGAEERALEGEFYSDYRRYRQVLVAALRGENPSFAGTSGQLVRLAQRLLDRLIFLLYCEDMGAALGFPPNLLGDLLRAGVSSYDTPDGGALWERLKGLFRVMNDGGSFGGHTINRFNGGLFAQEPALESLRIPNRVFVPSPDGDAGMLTLLAFSEGYNFGVRRHGEDRRPMIDAYTLGRIFEQSITELEIMEAEAEGRPSLNLLSRRKRDGVYYTPEWVTDYIVRETLGPRLEELKLEAGITPARRASLRALDRYEALLSGIKVVDPACGSGAFLVQALEFLLAERRWIAAERERHTGRKGIYAWDTEAVYRFILTNNIYGVDINPESVEITRLALWLHTALPNRPLTALDHTIRCGNSLVGPEFEGWYRDSHTTLFASADAWERINVFDWYAAFPEVFDRGGFDCVIGNPPYVKLQNFRVVEREVANFLSTARTLADTPRYRSTQTGSFDLYLPFIERGLELLAPGGRMGCIAPSLWMLNDYGRGLREHIRERRALDRWVDFKSYQVFQEATTYTALQFYTNRPVQAIRHVSAPDGEIGAIEWDEADRIDYTELPAEGAWTLLPREDRVLIERLRAECRALGDPRWTRQIFQGLITSADSIYHLRRVGPGRYLHTTGEKEQVEVEIEDALMRPLVKGSGSDVSRYRRPQQAIWLLFPYAVERGEARLLSAGEMQQRFPKGWAYLRRHEQALRARERSSFDDDAWYRFGRHQNIDKQALPKLMIPQIQLRLGCALDEEGEWYLHNVAVGGVIASEPEELAYLAGILNGPVANFVWRRTAKPFDGDYRAANRQFIAPLPVPEGTPEARHEVARRARELQELHSRRRDRINDLGRRLDSPQMEHHNRDEHWLWSDVRRDAEAWVTDAPPALTVAGRRAWARGRRTAAIDQHLALLGALLRPGATLGAHCVDGELTLSVNGVPALRGIYLDDDGEIVAAQWRQYARTTSITASTTAQGVLRGLLKLRRTENAALVRQILALDREIEELNGTIEKREGEMNGLVLDLYDLSPEERLLVERA